MASEPKSDADAETARNVPSKAPVAELSSVEASLAGPQWLHPTSIGFELLSTLRQFIWAAVLALVLAGTGSQYALLAAGMAVFVTAAKSLLRFLTLRYQLVGGELRINEGLIFRRHRTVRVSRIQNIDLLQNPLHHWFGVAEVRVDTAGGQEPEATLRVLSLRDIERLRAAIFQHPTASTQDGSPADAHATAPAGNTPVSPESAAIGPVSATGDASAVILRIPTGRLIYAGLLSNRGLVLIPILFGLFFQFDLEERIDIRHVEKYLPGDLSTATTIAGAVVAAVSVLAVVRIASVGWFLLRFHGYCLERHGEDLRISCGLITRVSATIPRRRIQFISVQQTLLTRMFDLAAIRLETAGGAAKQEEDASITVARRWFVPVLHIDEVPTVMKELRDGLAIEPETLAWQTPAPRARERLIRLAIVQSIVVAGLAVLLIGPWGFLVGGLLLPLLIYWAVRYARSLKYARSDRYVIFRSGILNRKTSLTFFDKVQTVVVRESLFDRRWGMATLNVDTAAAGPAGHRIQVKYLPAAVAFDELHCVAANASMSKNGKMNNLPEIPLSI